MQDFSGVAGRAELVRLFVGDGRIQIALLHPLHARDGHRHHQHNEIGAPEPFLNGHRDPLPGFSDAIVPQNTAGELNKD